ncbi:MAG: hypothetical protein U0V72_11285 [Cytophagales bacterium]
MNTSMALPENIIMKLQLKTNDLFRNRRHKKGWSRGSDNVSCYVMKNILFYILMFANTCISAQISNKFLTGDWKVYLEDSITFEFLRLKSDGTGIKCFGQTINGKDTLFTNHFTSINITDWKVKANKLTLQSYNAHNTDINPEYYHTKNPEYNLIKLENDKIQLEGIHLKLGIYPSFLNKETFYRVVIFQKANKIITPKRTKIEGCIETQKLFTFIPINDSIQQVTYIGFKDIIPWIIGCNIDFEYISSYTDPPYTFRLPAKINTNTFGFGKKFLSYSLESIPIDSTESQIDIYYDFDDSHRIHFLTEMQKGKKKVVVTKVNGHDIYTSVNWEGNYTGQIFLGNHLIIAYYTSSYNQVKLLQNCIASFRYQ